MIDSNQIVYVNYIRNLDQWSGQFEKVLQQVRAINRLGLPIQTYILTFTPSKMNVDQLTFIQIPGNYGNLKLLFFLTKFISNYFTHARVLILRQAVYSPLFWLYFRKRRFKLITELHSKLFHELRSVKKNVGVYWLQRLSYKLCQSVIDGKISVTKEIAAYDNQLGYDGPIQCIPNGVEVAQTQCGFKPFNGRVLSIIFVGSLLRPWHGLDRFLSGLERYSGSVQFELSIVGNIHRSVLHGYSLSEHKIQFHGAQKGDSLDRLYKNSTIAIGSLALHRMNLTEAASLKTREYLSKGVPFIYAYQDADFDDVLFGLKFLNNDDPINMMRVIEFADYVTSKSSDIKKGMKDLSERVLSWDIKMQEYLSFCDRI